MPTRQMDSVVRYIRRLALHDARGMSDAQLLECFLTQQDETAFETLVTRHGPLVLSVCRRVLNNLHDAEDAFQATFLVLVRRAASIGKRELLANWLYGVAYRTAMKSRTAGNRKRAKEKQLEEVHLTEALADEIPDELLAWLDRELIRLPDKYRLPVVCCDLQAMSRTEAAKKLGWPIGTLNWRLAKARSLLAQALSRHGLHLSAGALVMALSRPAAHAALSPSLAQFTAKAGKLMLTTRSLSACSVSAKVASLTEGIVKSMFLTKLKMGMFCLISIAVFGGATGLASSGAFAPKQTTSQEQQKSAEKPAEEPTKKERGAAVARNNFLVIAPSPAIARAIANAAEEYRQSIALEWFGEEKPRWSKQCVITIKVDPHNPSGATAFGFQDGKVESAQMNLNGPLDQLLESELPHEIAHVLLAHHFGTPLPRWADEGAAVLSSAESDRATHEKAFQQIRNSPDRFIPLEGLFAMKDYGKDSAALYAEGFSITKFLVDSANRAVFLEFLADGMRDGWEKATSHHYGYDSIAAMEAAWLKATVVPKSSADASSETSQSKARPEAPKQKLLTTEPAKTTELGNTQFFKSLGSYDSSGIPHSYYTFTFRLVRVGLKGVDTARIVLKHGDEVRLVQINGTWQQDGEKKLDTSNASAVLVVKLTVSSSDKPQLELTVQDNDVRRAYKDNRLVVSSNLHSTQEVILGRESRRILAESDNKVPKRWLEFALQQGVPIQPEPAK